MSARPADFPPPFDWHEFVSEPTDPPDERIDVGVLVVGAGPAGLSAAIRIGQLLEEHPEMQEHLGDVPVAVVEKGKAPGRAPALRRGRQPARLPGALPGHGHGGDALPRRGRPRGRLLPDREAASPRAGAADDVEPQPPRRLARGDRALARRARRGGRRDDRPRDERAQPPGQRWARRRHPHGRQGTRQGRGGAGELRAGLRHPCSRDHPRRGDAGPPGRHRVLAVRARTRARRSTRSASRRSGRSRVRSTA